MIGWGIAATSVIINILLLWYIRQLLIKFNYIGESTGNIYFSMEDFEKHLESVYELETFFGDPTLTGLLNHCKDIKEDLGEYRDIFVLEIEEPLPPTTEPEGEVMDAQ